MDIEALQRAPWVLLPGTLCTGAAFDPFLDALSVPAAARRVIPLDSPRIADYLPRLQKLVSEKTVICGFSLGAIVAAHLADQVTAAYCLLFGLNPKADDPAKRDGRLALAADVECLGGAAALGSRLAGLAGPNPAAARAHILAMAESASGQINAQTQLALDRPGALGALGRARMPVTLVTGRLDQQAPLELAHLAAAAAPRGDVIALEGLGHYAIIEDPEACARGIANHLASDLNAKRQEKRHEIGLHR